MIACQAAWIPYVYRAAETHATQQHRVIMLGLAVGNVCDGVKAVERH
jgi:hypothetical protein